MARYMSANDIINQTCIETGLLPNTDPVASTEDTYIQMTGLLTACGQELVEMYPWQTLRSVYSITTQTGDSGSYPLPNDFSYMIDQTGWNISSRMPVGGPLSEQQWAYLDGIGVGANTLYASFRLFDNTFNLFPQPPAEGITVRFEYISRNWVQEANTQVQRDSILTGSDIVLYEGILIKKFLKVKWLDSKGFASDSARMDFDTILQSRMGKDKGGQILSASSNYGYPYLNQRNVPFTNFGL